MPPPAARASADDERSTPPHAQARVTAPGASQRGGGLASIPVTVLLVGVGLCWGLNNVCMRVAARYVPPLTVATARAAVGGLLLLALAVRNGADRPRTREEWTGIAWIALMMTGLSTAGLFLAAKYVPAGVVSIFANTMPLFTALLAPILIGERLHPQVLLGLAVGLAGSVIVAWRAIHGDLAPIGVFWALIGAIAAALGAIMYRRHPLPRLDRLMAVAVQLLFSAVLLAVMSLPEDRSHMRFTRQFLLVFAYLSLIGLTVSFVLFSELLRRATAMQASVVAYLSTVFGVGLGALLLGERMSVALLVGGVVALTGVAMVQTAQVRLQRTPPPADT